MFFVTILPIILNAQIEIPLPTQIDIRINESPFTPTDAWTDSLIDEAKNGYLRYEIITSLRIDGKIDTKIRIPQTFTLERLLRQIIYYYALLSDEKSRAKEKILIYPFFYNINHKAKISCVYHTWGIYKIHINQWDPVEIPETPIPEHKFLYNQLVEAAINEAEKRDGITEEVYRTIAKENNISIEALTEIYQSVKLWQMAQ